MGFKCKMLIIKQKSKKKRGKKQNEQCENWQKTEAFDHDKTKLSWFTCFTQPTLNQTLYTF